MGEVKDWNELVLANGESVTFEYNMDLVTEEPLSIYKHAMFIPMSKEYYEDVTGERLYDIEGEWYETPEPQRELEA